MSGHKKNLRERLALVQEEAAKHGGRASIIRQGKGAHVILGIEGPRGMGVVGFTSSACDPRAMKNMASQIKGILSNGKTKSRERA